MITLREWIDQVDNALKDKPKFHRFTLWEDAKKVVDELGLMVDKDSKPDLYEWYLTFDNESDVVALKSILKTNVSKPTFRVSVYSFNPKA